MRAVQKLKFLMLSFFISGSLYAQIDPVGKDKVAIGGYDVVAYFVPGKAVKGHPDISAVYNNVTYYFESESHKQLFTADPEKYLPQYDGYCALAVGSWKKKVSINPEAYRITDGKLYLFYNGAHALSGNKFNSVEPWIKDEKNLIKKANENWPALKSRKM
jgi:YHS domain-containing protein